MSLKSPPLASLSSPVVTKRENRITMTIPNEQKSELKDYTPSALEKLPRLRRSNATIQSRTLKNSLLSPSLPIGFPSYRSMLLPEAVIDIAESKKMLRPTDSENNIRFSPRRRALARNSNGGLTASTQKISETSHLTTILATPPISSFRRVSISESSSLLNEEEEHESRGLNDSVAYINDKDVDSRNILFQFPHSEILAFEESEEEEESGISSFASKGRLLGHGALEIYQLHNKSVTYLHCGAVVHAILPRLKILRVSYNQFIMTLSNPERYWRIILHTEDDNIIESLVVALKTICCFRDVYFPLSNVTITSSESSSKEKVGIVPSLDQVPFIQRIKSSVSMNSISTDVACLVIDSDTTGTYVEDEPYRETTDEPKNSKENYIQMSPNNINNVIRKSISDDSLASSLDEVLDDFLAQTQDLELGYLSYQQVTTQPRSESLRETIVEQSMIDQSFLESLSVDDGRNNCSSVQVDPLMFMDDSLRSRETCWMDIDDNDQMGISTNFKSNIRRNLNPNIRVNMGSSSVNTDQSFSSVDVYKILSTTNERSNIHTEISFGGFIKTLFGIGHA